MGIAAWIRGLLAGRRSRARRDTRRRFGEELFPNLFVRPLEARRVLNGTALAWDHAAAETTIDAGPLADDGAPDTFLVARQGEELHVSVAGREVYSAPLADLERLTLNGSDDADTLVLDLSGGDPLPDGGLIFQGGDGRDRVLVEGGSSAPLVDTVTHRFDGIGDGFLHVAFSSDGASGPASALSYTGVESILDTAPAAQRVFRLNGPAEVVTLSDAAGAGDGLSTITSSSGTSVTFATPGDSLGVELDAARADDADTLTIDGLDGPFAADLVIRGDADDTLHFTGDVDLEGHRLAAGAGTIRVGGTIASAGGSVQLEAQGEGTLDVAGTIDVADAAPGRTGGTVHLLGDRVSLLDGATVDASGDAGGGTALVGGDYRGANPEIANATLTYVAPGATIRADALSRGDGGRIVVWADRATHFYGALTARGGHESGDGGLAEISGRVNLVQRGTVDLRARQGATGTLLLDPLDIVIVGGTADGHDHPDPDPAALIHAAGSNKAGTIALADEGSGAPVPFVVYESEIEAQGAAANVVLEARNRISVTGAFTHDADGSGGDDPGYGVVLIRNGNSLVLRTRNDAGDGIGGIDLTGSAAGSDLVFMTTAGGSIAIETGSDGSGGGGSAPGAAPVTLGRLAAADGDVLVSAEGTLNVTGDVAAGGSGAIRLVTTGGGDVHLRANVVDVEGDSLVVVDSSDAITQKTGTLIAAQELRLTADNAIGAATSSSAHPVLTRVENLSAALDGAAATGRIVVVDVDDLNVTAVDGQSGVTTTGGNDVGIGSYSGTITVLDAVTTTGSGRIAIGSIDPASVDPADFDLADVVSTGDVVLRAEVRTDSGDLALGARNVFTYDAGTITQTADGGTLLLAATEGLGTAADPVRIDVAEVAAVLTDSAATGGVFLTQVDGYHPDLTTGTFSVGPVTVYGVATLGDNDVRLETEAGSLHVTRPVASLGAGSVTLAANGASSDVVTGVGAGDVLSAGGNVTVIAGRAITLGDRLASGGGDVALVTGTGDTGVLTLAGGGTAAGSIASAGGAIAVDADDLVIVNPAPGAIDAGTGRVTIRPADATDASRPIDLGSDTPGRLGITAAELARITTTGVLQIGDGLAGDVLLSDSVTAPGGTLRIESSGSLTTTAEANAIAADRLAIEVDGDVGASGSRISTGAAQLAVRSNVAGGVYLAGTGAGVTVATVDGLSGIATTAGDVDLTVLGDLAVSAPIAAGAGGDLRLVTSGGGDLHVGADLTDQASDGLVVLDADGAITQAPGTLIAARSLRLTAGDAIGSATTSTQHPIFTQVENISAALDSPAAAGRIVVAEADDLNVTAVDGQSGISALGGNDVGIGSYSGTITVLDAVTTTGAGRIAIGSIDPASVDPADFDLADVVSTGDVVLRAEVRTDSGDLALGARNVFTYGEGRIAQTADGGTLLLAATEGIGTAADPVRIDVAEVAAVLTDSAATGGIFLTQGDGYHPDLTIGTFSVGPVTVYGLATLGDNAINVRTEAGSLTVARPVVAAGGGEVSLSAEGATGDLKVEQPVSSFTAELRAARDIKVNAFIGFFDYVEVHADNDVTLGPGAVVSSEGAVRIAADADGAADGSSGALVMDNAASIEASTLTLSADEDETLANVATRTLDVTSASGRIVDTPDARIAVTGAAAFLAASEITLGDEPGNTTHFGTLDLTGTAVTVSEDSATLLARASADTLHLTSSGAIEDAGDVLVAGAAVFDSGTGPIILGDQLGRTTNFGSLELIGGDVTIQEDSETRLVGADVASLSVTSAGDLVIGRRIDGTPADRAVRAAGPITLDAAGDLRVPNLPGLLPGQSEIEGASITAEAGGAIRIEANAVLESATGKVTNTPPILRIGERDPDKVITPGDTRQELVGSAGGIEAEGEKLELGENFTVRVLWDDGLQSVVPGVDAGRQLRLEVAQDGAATVSIAADGTPQIELDLSRAYPVEYLATVTETELLATIELENDPNIRLSDSSGVDLNRASAVVATDVSGEEIPQRSVMEFREPEPIAMREPAPVPPVEMPPVAPQARRSEPMYLRREEVVEEKREIYIVKVGPDGEEGEPRPLPDDALADLSALFERLKERGLPNGLYRIYLEEVGLPRRKVIEFYKSGDTFGQRIREPGRGSMPILNGTPETKPPPDTPPNAPPNAPPDPAVPKTNDTERPDDAPSDDASAPQRPDGAADPGAPPEAPAADPAADDAPAAARGWSRRLSGAAALAAGGLVAVPAWDGWQRRVDRTLEESDDRSFRRAARLRRRLSRSPRRPIHNP